jgi:hypothetical protein
VFDGTHALAAVYLAALPSLVRCYLNCPHAETQHHGTLLSSAGGPGFQHPNLRELVCQAHSLQAAFFDEHKPQLPKLQRLSLNTDSSHRTAMCLLVTRITSTSVADRVRVSKTKALWTNCVVRVLRKSLRDGGRGATTMTAPTEGQWHKLCSLLPALEAEYDQIHPVWVTSIVVRDSIPTRLFLNVFGRV